MINPEDIKDFTMPKISEEGYFKILLIFLGLFLGFILSTIILIILFNILKTKDILTKIAQLILTTFFLILPIIALSYGFGHYIIKNLYNAYFLISFVFGLASGIQAFYEGKEDIRTEETSKS